jgi:serine protease Do
MIKHHPAIAALGVAAAVAAGCGQEEIAAPKLPQALSQQELIEAAGPAVVAIRVKGRGWEGVGTGVRISAREVLTVAHIPDGAQQIEVRVDDGEKIAARVKGMSMCGEQALLELTETPDDDFTIVPLAQTSNVEAGSDALLLSYQSNVEKFGRQSLTTTKLIVSNTDVGRADMGDSFPRLRDLLGVDGNVRAGASGAAPFDGFGNALGLITIGSTGEAYAVRVEEVRDMLPELRDGYRLDDLGATFTALSEADVPAMFAADPSWRDAYWGDFALRYLRRNFGVRDGLVIDAVADGGPAAKAKPGGIWAGDLLTEVNGVSIKSVHDLCGVLRSVGPGDEITLRGHFLTSTDEITYLAEPWKTTTRTRR